LKRRMRKRKFVEHPSKNMMSKKAEERGITGLLKRGYR